MMCSCRNQPKIVVIEDKLHEYNMSFNYYGNDFEYTLSKEGDSYKFTPVNNTTPIIFSVVNGNRFIENNGVKYEWKTNQVLAIPLIIGDVIKSSIGAEIVPDYNGEYKHYGSTQNGEYCLTMDSNANVVSLEIESFNLKAEFK